ncbi:unnamed protein product [Cuscuta epithymum]|uniref:Zinc finger PHD-type domain-containing protein n=1 Tax=Cuscuta epithymum TaxID=186058 RepID=A0AAV0DLY1_9ASTE|nr:unnamed protein product [Cuscuta epithymum]
MGKKTLPNMVCSECGSSELGYLIVKCSVCTNAKHRYCMTTVSFDPAFTWMCDECKAVINQMHDLDSFGMVPEIKPEMEMAEDLPFQPFQIPVKEEVLEMDDVLPFAAEVKEEVVEPGYQAGTSQPEPLMVSFSEVHPEPMEDMDEAVEMVVDPPTARRSPRKRKLNRKYFAAEIVVTMSFKWLTGEDEI